MGITWLKVGLWKVRGIRRGFERGNSRQCLGEGDAEHIPLKLSETKKWREEFLCNKWLSVNENIAHKKIIKRTNVTKEKTLESIYSKLHSNRIT
jgi:hypothetical protein